jgi:hypothetical protein
MCIWQNVMILICELAEICVFAYSITAITVRVKQVTSFSILFNESKIQLEYEYIKITLKH